jgi:hypothetical protein
MPPAKITKPAKVRDFDAVATISTQEWASDAAGVSKPAVVSTKLNTPCRINTLSPSEAVRYGYAVNETVYRVLMPVRHPDGTDIILSNQQFLTINNIKYQISGEGKPEGDSGYQTAIVKRKVR